MVTARDICLRFLHDNLTVPLAGDILETSHIHEDKKLEKEALLFIKNHWEEVVQTPGMGKWCRDCLNKVNSLQVLKMFVNWGCVLFCGGKFLGRGLLFRAIKLRSSRLVPSVSAVLPALFSLFCVLTLLPAR